MLIRWRHLLAILLTTLPALLWAQSLPAGRNEEVVLITEEGVVAVLVLDTAQQEQLVEIERRYSEELRSLVRQDTLTEEQSRSHAEAIATEREHRIKAVLTPDQYDQWTRRSRACTGP